MVFAAVCAVFPLPGSDPFSETKAAEQRDGRMDGGWAAESACCPRLGRLHTLDRVNKSSISGCPAARHARVGQGLGRDGFVGARGEGGMGGAVLGIWEKGSRHATGQVVSVVVPNVTHFARHMF